MKTKKVDALSGNIYLRLLVKLYKYLVRRTNSKFNKVVLKRLIMSRSHKRPISLGRLIDSTKNAKKGNVAVIVGTVTNDIRVLDVPKDLKIAALHITESARRRITENGGTVYSLDQLAQIAPEGKGTVLLRGNYNTETKKHFGTPGASGSHSKPKVRSKGRNFEKGRGRRNSSGYKKK